MRPHEWTQKPRGEVLIALGQHLGRPVTIWNYKVAGRTERPTDALARLADRIVSEG